MDGLRQVFLDFTSFGAGQSGSSEMDSAKFVKLAKVQCKPGLDIKVGLFKRSFITCRNILQRNSNTKRNPQNPGFLQAALIIDYCCSMRSTKQIMVNRESFASA